MVLDWQAQVLYGFLVVGGIAVIPWRMVGRISILISLLLLSVTLYLRTVNPEQARTVIILAIISSGVGVVANRIDRLRSR